MIAVRRTYLPKPGTGGKLTVKVKGRHYIGVLHKSIIVYSNDPVNPVISLKVSVATATVVPEP